MYPTSQFHHFPALWNKQKPVITQITHFMMQAINTKLSNRKEIENENNDNLIKVKELDHKMVKFQKDSKDAAHKVGYTT